MRVFILILVLIFSLQSWTNADDVRDFEIEGVSLGDSLLDFFSEEEINENKYFLFKNKRWGAFLNISSSYENYEALQIFFDNKDNRYTIHRIDGLIAYPKKIDDCNKKKDSIVSSISSLLETIKKRDKNEKHNLDKSGKSFVYQTIFDFPSGDTFAVECYDWEGELENQYMDKLVVAISSKEILDFVNAYSE